MTFIFWFRRPMLGAKSVAWLATVIGALAGAGAASEAIQKTESVKGARPEIRGSVVEPGTPVPVTEAEVLLFKVPGEDFAATVGTFAREKALHAASTDAWGGFRFALEELGHYRVQVRKDGYGEALLGQQRVASSATVNLTSERPAREIQLMLARPAEISGGFFDLETEKPISGLDVVAYLVFYGQGKRRQIPAAFGTTGSDGRFVMKKVPPGEYLIGIRVRPWGPRRIVQEFSREEVEAVDAGYEDAFWPGRADDIELAAPVPVGSGQLAEVGQLAVKAAPFHRLHVSIPAGACAPDEKARVAIAKAGTEAYETTSEVQCGKDFVVRGLPPGSYHMRIALSGRARENRMFGSATFSLFDKNEHVTAGLARGVDIGGQVVASAGARVPQMKTIRIALMASGGEESVVPDDRGMFRILNTPRQDKELLITGIPDGYYFKEALYNGQAVRGRTLALDGQALTHSLQIILDDKAAAVAGTVRDRDRPVSQPSVVLVRWPLSSPSALWPLVRATGDEDGRFQFTGLAPGEYRILAVSPTAALRLEDPNVLPRLLPNAKECRLAAGGFQNLTLELADLR